MSKIIRILTWNVFWKAMTEKQLNECPTTRNGTFCSENVSRFVDQAGPFDLVCFQETSNYQKIVKNSLMLSSMSGVQYKPGNDRLISMYNTHKLLPDSYPNKLDLHMSTINRPCFILFFHERVAVINLHAGHGADAQLLNQYIEQAINSLDPINATKIIKKLWRYDIIIAGDFNEDLFNRMNYLIVAGRKRRLFGGTREPTCCDMSMRAQRLALRYDHILSTVPTIQTSVIRVQYASDHMPVIGLVDLTKTVAYDFDGVFHLTVKPVNSLGQRHHYPNRKLEPFDYMINRVEDDLAMGNRVIIITARSDKHKDHITNFLNSYFKKKPIHVVYTSGKSKVRELAKYSVNVFYDDSPYNILDAYKARDVMILQMLTDIYYVVPEENRCIWVDEKLANIMERNIASSIDTLDSILKKKTNIDDLAKQVAFVIRDNNTYLLDPHIRNLVERLDDNLEYDNNERTINSIQRSIAKRLLKLSVPDI